MRRLLLALSIAAAGCIEGATTADAGTSDAGGIDTSQIVGTWRGTSSINGQVVSSNAQTVITDSGGGVVHLSAVCPDGASGCNSTVTSPTAFTLIPCSCPATPVTGCSSAVLSFLSGTGTISSGTLTFSASGSVAGCGGSSAVTLAFTGTH
jgi:hypothetical protein